MRPQLVPAESMKQLIAASVLDNCRPFSTDEDDFFAPSGRQRPLMTTWNEGADRRWFDVLTVWVGYALVVCNMLPVVFMLW